MKRWVSVLLIVLFVSTGATAFAQTQATVNGINYGSSSLKAMVVDQDHMILIGEQVGVQIETSGKGPFNNMSTHIALIMWVDKGAYHYHGYETHMDKGGDKFVAEIWDFPAGSNKGQGKIIAATGKFAGMEGTLDFVLLAPPPGFPEGTTRTVAQETWKLTLKNPL